MRNFFVACGLRVANTLWITVHGPHPALPEHCTHSVAASLTQRPHTRTRPLPINQRRRPSLSPSNPPDHPRRRPHSRRLIKIVSSQPERDACPGHRPVTSLHVVKDTVARQRDIDQRSVHTIGSTSCSDARIWVRKKHYSLAALLDVSLT